MAAFAIEARDGHTIVTLVGPQESFSLGLPHAHARTRESRERMKA